MSKWKHKLKLIITKIHENPLVDLALLTFSGTMCCFAIALKDWLGMIFTCYPLNLFIFYCFTRKKMSNTEQEIAIFIISFLYLLYIWTPLTDGTVSNAIREITSNR